MPNFFRRVKEWHQDRWYATRQVLSRLRGYIDNYSEFLRPYLGEKEYAKRLLQRSAWEIKNNYDYELTKNGVESLYNNIYQAIHLDEEGYDFLEAPDPFVYDLKSALPEIIENIFEFVAEEDKIPPEAKILRKKEIKELLGIVLKLIDKVDKRLENVSKTLEEEPDWETAKQHAGKFLTPLLWVAKGGYKAGKLLKREHIKESNPDYELHVYIRDVKKEIDRILKYISSKESTWL